MPRLSSILLILISAVLPGVTPSVIYPRPSSPNETPIKLNPRDSWTTFNTTARQTRIYTSTIESRSKENVAKTTVSTKDIFKAVDEITNGVTITWYTGHDLLNPSCWPQPIWTPTDESYVCAITLDGWEDKPRCFQFIQLCANSKKCTVCRVVDTCAGCAAGSKHVDLTKAAFSELADLAEGTLQISMQNVLTPAKADWDEKLWGPFVPLKL